ncbi:MAG: YlbF family regulator [Candidatus Promineifilaceae bacterium]
MIQLETQIPLAPEASVFLALSELADVIKEQPEYSSLVEVFQTMRSDSEAQQMLRDLQAWQRRGILPEDEEVFQERLEQFYTRPSVADYYAAESALKDILKQIDAMISDVTGIDFAANAKRSCCGG